MTQTNIILRVVLPSLGVSQYLEETLTSISVLDKSIRLHCILIIPWGKMISVFSYPWLKIVNEPVGFSGGLYGAINLAARESGNWTHITYINDDDGLIGPLYASQFIESDISYGRVLVKHGNSEIKTPLTVCKNPALLPLIWYWKAPGIYQHGTIIARSLYERIGGFDETFRLAADHAFWLRAWKAHAKFCFRDETVGYFRVRPGQLSANTSNMKLEIDRATLLNEIKVSFFKRIYGYVYWRLMGITSVLSRIRYGQTIMMNAGQ